MCHSIGIDTEPIERFRSEVHPNRLPAFYERCFTEEEIKSCLAYSDSAQHFAVRYCAKEAVIKALDGILEFSDPKQIEIVSGEGGRPYIRVHHPDFHANECLLALSLTHSNATAIAVVSVIMVGPSRPRR